MAYCTNCGKETEWTSKSGFCKECAEKVLKEKRSSTSKTKPLYKRLWFWLACVFLVAILASAVVQSLKNPSVPYDDIIESFGVAGYIDETNNLVVYTVFTGDIAGITNSIKEKIASMLMAEYAIDEYPNISQITVVLLDDSDSILLSWNYDSDENLVDLDNDFALAALALARYE